jgi:uncharacterized membrane protein
VIPRWLLWSLFAVLCWGIWAIVFQLIGAALTPAQSQALSTLGLLPVLIALGFSKKLVATGNRRRGIVLAFVAGMLVCLGNIAYYRAFTAGGKASTIVPLTALYPLVTIVLAMLLLRERLSAVQFVGIGLSLAAIWLFNISATDGWLNKWLVYVLVPIGLWGLAGLLQKISTNEISGELSTLAFLTAFIPVALVIFVLQPLAHALPVRVWVLVTLLGLLFSLGNLALLMAFASSGKASVIAPLAGLYPVVSVPAAILFLGEKVGAREWVGIIMALVAIVALSCDRTSTHETARSAASTAPVVDLK